VTRGLWKAEACGFRRALRLPSRPPQRRPVRDVTGLSLRRRARVALRHRTLDAGSMTGLAGRPVLVTGAASGIGEATAMRLVREGAAVALVDRDAGRLASLKDVLARDG